MVKWEELSIQWFVLEEVFWLVPNKDHLHITRARNINGDQNLPMKSVTLSGLMME